MPTASDPQPWDAIFRREGRVFDSPAPVVHHVAEVLERHGCRRVVDLGCGSGRHVVFLAQRGFDVIGIDNSPEALRLSREWLVQEGLPARLIRADIRRALPAAASVCDALISTQVIHHALLATVRGTAREIRRVVRPGGVLFVSVPSGTDPEDACAEVEPGTFVPTKGSEAGLPHHIFSPEELASLFPEFATLESYEIGDRILTLLAVRSRSGPEEVAGSP